MQAVCDANLRFTNVVAKWPGSTHDSFVLKDSELWEAYESRCLKGHILGDGGYPSRNWLLTPYRNPVTDAQKKYNYAHIRTRVLIEQAFGQLKRRFNILYSKTRLGVDKVAKVVVVCCMLHNLAVNRKLPEVTSSQGNSSDTVVPNVQYNGNLNTGTAYRDHIAGVISS